jgi:hypothetical protein
VALFCVDNTPRLGFLFLSRSLSPGYDSNHPRWKASKLGILGVDWSTPQQRIEREFARILGEFSEKREALVNAEKQKTPPALPLGGVDCIATY